MDEPYSPFPEIDLAALVGWHMQASRLWKPGSSMRLEHEARAKVCRDALASHVALRDRFLEKTAEYREALGQHQVPA